MLNLVVTLLIIALIAAVLGFGGIGGGPTDIEPHIAALNPTCRLQSLHECCDAGLPDRIVGEVHQHANASHGFALLRARRERPRCRSAERG